MHINNWHLNIENAEYLKKLYNNRSAFDISKILHFSIPTIHKMLKELGINLRTDKERKVLGAKKRLKYVKISDELNNIITGCLLGDGTITNKTNCQAYFKYSDTNKDFIYWLKEQFDKCDIDSKIRFIPEHFDKRGFLNSDSWVFTTKSYVNFLELYNKWYCKIKRIPNDVLLSQSTLKYWWIGDGYLSKTGGGTIATHGFTFEDNEFLKTLLQNVTKEYIAIYKSNFHNKFFIYLSRRALNDLYIYMGSCPVESYKYKWR